MVENRYLLSSFCVSAHNFFSFASCSLLSSQRRKEKAKKKNKNEWKYFYKNKSVIMPAAERKPTKTKRSRIKAAFCTVGDEENSIKANLAVAPSIMRLLITKHIPRFDKSPHFNFKLRASIHIYERLRTGSVYLWHTIAVCESRYQNVDARTEETGWM